MKKQPLSVPNADTPSPPSTPFAVEVVPILSLKPHPRNYRGHPDDEIEHIKESIRINGIYRNIIVARDGTLLAGHGVMEAARRLGYTDVPIHRLDIDKDSPNALKILAGDNYIAHLAEDDDRALTELLKELCDIDVSELLGTGFDEQMLAAFAMVTRNKNEIASYDEAAQWAGMPDYEAAPPPSTCIMQFLSEEDRQAFAELIGVEIKGNRPSLWWPEKPENVFLDKKFVG